MKKTILITGSESFVASVLIKNLKKKYNIIGIDFLKKKKNTKYTNFNIDIRKPFLERLKNSKIDYIIHLAAISNDNDAKKNPINCFKTNVLGTLNMLDFANKKNVKNFVFASTQWVYDFSSKKNYIVNDKTIIDPFNIESEYGLSKLISEINIKQNFKKNKLNSTILRFGIIYGPRLKNLSAFEGIFFKLIKENKIDIGSAKTGRNFIHIEDICVAIEKSLKMRGLNTFNLEGDEYITLKKLISSSSRILKKKIEINENNPNDISKRKISNKVAKNKLRWNLKFNLEKGLINLLNYKYL
jgi:UDP-glucose 4-epimerase